jgi:hypothetical protein
VSSPRNSRYFVAIKMGRRRETCRRVGVLASGEVKTAFRHGDNDREVSTKLMTFANADTPVRRYISRSASGLTSFVVDVTLRIMGDKSPKAVHKQAAQKQVKAKAANQKKSNAASVKQVPKPK